ncbi:MAG: hypothetical protein R2874_15710 [Desulfobacterales bacterium]
MLRKRRKIRGTDCIRSSDWRASEPWPAVAHDFNNLLMGIQGNISLLMLRTGPSEYNYKKLKSIESCIISGTKLTQQLLGFARGGKYMAKLLDFNRIVMETAHVRPHT